MNLINCYLQIFIEEKGASSDSILVDFEKSARASTGALLFAVMNGKLSEGINFSDDSGRGVIVIGLPFPNANEMDIQESIKGYSELMIKIHPEKDNQSLQSEFLENACMRTINQTIGTIYIGCPIVF